ncbi:MAG: helix-turn-helix domain-containing protein [Candidatus Krumholzibacteriota bacterium]
MPRKNLHLTRQKLDATLARFEPVADLAPSDKGWIRTIRRALGMSGRQLAKRLGLSKQSVARMEKDEMTGALSLKTLSRVAEGLDCVLVYGLVPRESLEKLIYDRARTLVGGQNASTDETTTGNLVDDLVVRMPRDFWD